MSKKFINFKVNARHISQLGKELVTDYNTALVEIVKNSYDADAEGVKVIFENITSSKAKLIIIDNGSGMTQADIENKWTVIGTNNKVRESRSPGGRKYAGKKGIGRFAVERLAEKITIYSFTSTERPFKFSLNWNKYEQINIQGLSQRAKLLQLNKHDIESAKYISNQIEYLLGNDNVSQEHKNEILFEIIEQLTIDYTFFLNNKKLPEIISKIIPILEIYQNEEVRVQDIYHELDYITEGETIFYQEYITDLKEQIHSEKDETNGIVMVLEGLRDIWRERDIKKIQKELRLLVAPKFLIKNPFKPILSCPDFQFKDEYIVNDILGLHFAKVEGKIFEDGNKLEISYQEKNTGNRETFSMGLPERYKCGDVNLDLFYFLREPKYLSSSELNVNQAKDILDQYCGVKIYRDGFHVKPYGDIGNDWVLLDQKRVRDPHNYRVSNNQLIGIVEISDESNPLLSDATDREGIIENEAFEDLRKFIIKCTDFISEIRRKEYLARENQKNIELAEKRRREEEERRRIEEERIEKERLERQRLLNTEINSVFANKENISKDEFLNITAELQNTSNKDILFYKDRLEEVRKKNEEADEEKKRLYEEELQNKDRELSLYKNLATLGILTGAFGHETSDIINRINANINYTKLKFPNELIKAEEKILRAYTKIDEDFKRISGYSKLIINFVQKKNREQYDYLNISQTIKTVTETYTSIISAQQIELLLKLEDFVIDFKMFKIDMESIIINMLTNSFEALKRTVNKKITISCNEDEEQYNFIFEDNGSGIPDGLNEKIFSPFMTTKENGVGLGLSIVKDLVEKYNGDIQIGNSDANGGAIFKIAFYKGRDR